MATLEELSAALIKADAAGNTADAKVFADEIRRLRAAPPSEPSAPVEGLPGPRMTRGQELYAAARPYVAPVVETGGALLGGLVGAGMGLPTGPGAALTGAAGAGLGYAGGRELMRQYDVAAGISPSAMTPPVQLGQEIASGAASELGGRMLGPALGWLGRKSSQLAGTVADIRDLPNQLASQMARISLGSPEKIAAAQNAMRSAEAQGLDLTAQQALARSGIIAPSAQATLETAIRRTSTVNARSAKEAAQEAARAATIRDITPDMASAVATRRAASEPLYKAADQAVVPIDADLTSVFSRMPEGVLGKAKELAKMEGRPFIMGETKAPAMAPTGVLDARGRPVMKEVPGTQAKITGESLHYIKRALSDIAYAPPSATGIGRDAQEAARGLLKDYLTVFESKVPQYAQARQTFSDLSAPINQAQVLKEMASVLEKPGGGERIGPFLNVLGRGEQAMLKRAGGRGAPRFEALDEVLTPEQLTRIREVAKQLETQSAVNTQITEGQQRASDLLKSELPHFRLPNVFNVFATTANKVLDVLGQKVSQKTVEKLAEASLSAKTFDELISTLPAEERNRVLKAVSDPATWTAFTTSAAKFVPPAVEPSQPAPINVLAPSQPTNNALAR